MKYYVTVSSLRGGDDYIPFIRLDRFQIVRPLTMSEGITHTEFMTNAMMRLVIPYLKVGLIGISDFMKIP